MIGFRVDSNKKIGMGHLMRCIAIAKACEKKGMQPLFILADDNNTEVLKNQGLDYCILNTDWQSMDEEVETLKIVIDDNNINKLVVDSYYVTDNYLRELDAIVPVLYVDDTQDRDKRYPVSALLHYSEFPGENSYTNKYKNTITKLLVGFDYVPLREEFQQLIRADRKKRILLTTGSTDPYNVMGKIAEIILKNSILCEYDVDIIVGAMNSNTDMLEELAKDHETIHLHRNVANMSRYMLECEIAVSAGGTTIYELCACGAPTIAFSFVDNQVDFTKKMEREDILMYAGDVREREAFYENISDMLELLCSNINIRKKFTANMLQMVDGCGCTRIADFLQEE